MKTSSAKNKGRKLQQFVRDSLRIVFAPLGTEDDDFKSTSMGVSGVDIAISPAGRNAIYRVTGFSDISVECKNQESINLCSTFWKHYDKYSKNGMPILIHKRNGTNPTVTLTWEDFILLLCRNMNRLKDVQE